MDEGEIDLFFSIGGFVTQLAGVGFAILIGLLSDNVGPRKGYYHFRVGGQDFYIFCHSIFSIFEGSKKHIFKKYIYQISLILLTFHFKFLVFY